MKTPIFILALLTIGNSFAQTPTTQPTGAPYGEVTHENKVGTITMTNGTVYNGTISYSEYGNRTIFLYQDGEEAMIFDDVDSIASMTIEGRGTFEAVYLKASYTKKAMVLVKERGDGFVEYQLFQGSVGLVGAKISGGNVAGEYHYYLYHERKAVMIHKLEVKKIDETIEEYIDYCPSIAELVKQKSKGYKVSLLLRDYDILKKSISESASTCPN